VNAIVSGTGIAGVSGGASSIGETTTNMSMTFTSNSAFIQQGATNIAEFTPTLNSSFQDLDMNNNDIINVTRIEGNTGQDMVLYSDDGITIAARDPLVINALDGDGLSVQTSSVSRMLITSAEIDVRRLLNMNSYAIENAGSINGLSVIGGNSAGTSNSALLTASTTETSILPLTFIGNRQVPADAFQQGDSFSATLAGSFGSQNGDDITIRLKGGATATTLLSSVVVPLNSSSASSFELDIQFSIRQTGAAGVAELVTNYAFTYNQSGGGGAFVGERNCEINTTTFDTTILNQLDITAQFSSANANNTIQTFMSNLHKIY